MEELLSVAWHQSLQPDLCQGPCVLPEAFDRLPHQAGARKADSHGNGEARAWGEFRCGCD